MSKIPTALPRLVAASRLRDSLSELLDTAASTNQNDYQDELLEELANDADVEVPKASEHRPRQTPGFCIAVCCLRIEVHKELSLEQGDLVPPLWER